MPKTGNEGFQQASWNIGCEHASLRTTWNISADVLPTSLTALNLLASAQRRCKELCAKNGAGPNIQGCCNWPDLGGCKSNWCSGGGCCAASETICNLACEAAFAQVPLPSSATGSSQRCTHCSIGMFSTIVDAVACIACPLGQYQSATGRDGCSICPTGTFANKSGLDHCSAFNGSRIGTLAAEVAAAITGGGGGGRGGDNNSTTTTEKDVGTTLDVLTTLLRYVADDEDAVNKGGMDETGGDDPSPDETTGSSSSASNATSASAPPTPPAALLTPRVWVVTVLQTLATISNGSASRRSRIAFLLNKTVFPIDQFAMEAKKSLQDHGGVSQLPATGSEGVAAVGEQSVNITRVARTIIADAIGENKTILVSTATALLDTMSSLLVMQSAAKKQAAAAVTAATVARGGKSGEEVDAVSSLSRAWRMFALDIIRTISSITCAADRAGGNTNILTRALAYARATRTRRADGDDSGGDSFVAGSSTMEIGAYKVVPETDHTETRTLAPPCSVRVSRGEGGDKAGGGWDGGDATIVQYSEASNPYSSSALSDVVFVQLESGQASKRGERRLSQATPAADQRLDQCLTLHSTDESSTSPSSTRRTLRMTPSMLRVWRQLRGLTVNPKDPTRDSADGPNLTVVFAIKNQTQDLSIDDDCKTVYDVRVSGTKKLTSVLQNICGSWNGAEFESKAGCTLHNASRNATDGSWAVECDCDLAPGDLLLTNGAFAIVG